ncbi:unnamed protein product [Amaranthus hypochondriacus]
MCGNFVAPFVIGVRFNTREAIIEVVFIVVGLKETNCILQLQELHSSPGICHFWFELKIFGLYVDDIFLVAYVSATASSSFCAHGMQLMVFLNATLS